MTEIALLPLLREGVSIIEMVEDAGVVSGAVGLVANGVTAAVEEISGWRSRREVEGISSRRSRRDVLSYIEHICDQQATRLCESLGMILNNIFHPPRTIVDIAKDYREAQRSLQDATYDESTSFWRSTCSKLSSVLEALN